MHELRGFKLVVALVLKFEKKESNNKRMQPLLFKYATSIISNIQKPLEQRLAGIIDSVADDAFIFQSTST